MSRFAGEARPTRRSLAAAGAVVGIVIVLVVAALTVRLPLLVLSPGTAFSVPAQVSFPAERADELTGDLLLTTVEVSQPTAAQTALAWIDGDEKVIQRDRVIPEGTDPREYFDAQRQVFAQAAQVAVAAGLAAAGRDVEFSGAGARVVSVSPQAPADGVLRAGDVITAVDGSPVELASDLVEQVSSRRAGQMVTLTVDRDGATAQRPVRLRRLGDRDSVGLGVAVATVDQRAELPFEVAVEDRRIGGPSAGLMIALTVYDLADDGDPVRGRVVAGTGTIDPDGNVGPVGGVDQKIEGALAAGAALFLAPDGEADAARAAADGRLPVIGVSTLGEAIRALEDTGEPREDTGEPREATASSAASG